jgi:hypothetical protein
MDPVGEDTSPPGQAAAAAPPLDRDELQDFDNAHPPHGGEPPPPMGCLSFLAEPKSNKGTLNLCFIMLATFHC